MCSWLHVLWGLAYIGCGAVQLVVGIIFLVALPFLRLGSNVWTGGWNVVAGVSGALIACVGPLSSPGRHEALLYLAISVLAANAVNLAILEIVEWRLLFNEKRLELEDFKKTNNNLAEFLVYVHLSTSAASLVAMAVAFIDSQLTFCSLQRATRRWQSRRRSSKMGQVDHSADTDYIMPRHVVRPPSNKMYEQCARSWVFDVDGGSARYQQLDSQSHADKCRDAAAAAVAAATAAEGRSSNSGNRSADRNATYSVSGMANGGAQGGKAYRQHIKHREQQKLQQHKHQLQQMQKQHKHQQLQHHKHQMQPQLEEDESPPSGTSPDSPDPEPGQGPGQSAENEDKSRADRAPLGLKPLLVIDADPLGLDSVSSRHCSQLLTFSRTPSPGASPAHSPCPARPSAPIPGQVAGLGMVGVGAVRFPNDPPIIECLERLALPQRLSLTGEAASCQPSPRTSSPRPLSSALSGSLDGSNSDQVPYASLMTELTQAIRKKPSQDKDMPSAEFCRELEEALQEIQDLDSSTGGTLVNASSATSSTAPPPPAPDWGDSDDSSSASNHTIGN